MQNVQVEVKGDNLILTVNLKKRFGRSKSGKSTIVATTEGIVNVPESDVQFGLNVFVK